MQDKCDWINSKPWEERRSHYKVELHDKVDSNVEGQKVNAGCSCKKRYKGQLKWDKIPEGTDWKSEKRRGEENYSFCQENIKSS